MLDISIGQDKLPGDIVLDQDNVALVDCPSQLILYLYLSVE